MKYLPTVDIWANPNMVNTIKRGQWVSAGPIDSRRSNIGRFCGVRKGNTVVVAWHWNAKNNGNYNEYVNACMTYGKPAT